MVYNNFNFASDEEIYTCWYLEELLRYNIIFGYEYQPKPFEITPVVTASYIKKMKKDNRVEFYSLMGRSEYTADFKMYWNPDYYKLFYCDVMRIYYQKHTVISPFITNYSRPKQLHYSVIDVKGTFDRHNNIRLFSIYQKLIYKLYGIYVQKIVPIPKVSHNGKISPLNALFYNTFIPERYLTQNKTRRKRTINFPYKLIEKYIDDRKKLY